MTEGDKGSLEPYNVPTAPFRPGDESDFGGPWIEQPGDLSRPDPVNCEAPDTYDHAHGLIRVLGDDDSASGEWDPEPVSYTHLTLPTTLRV